MFARWVIFAFLIASGLAASSTDFLLGIEYSHAVSTGVTPGLVVIDAQRFVYAASENSVTKYSAAGYPVWVASLGPSFFVRAIAVDLSGSVYAVSAGTISPNEVFVAKVNVDGTMSGPSVMLGTGLDAAALAVDGNGHLWVAGRTFPSFQNPLQTTANAYQKTLPNITSNHVFVARLNTNGTAVDYATYLSGSSDDRVSGVAVDGSGSAFITGSTQSTDFPLTASGDHGSGFAPFLTRLTPGGSGLVYSVLLGPGNGPAGGATNPTLTVDASGDAAVSYGTLSGSA
jgi:Beta-propeller repeat